MKAVTRARTMAVLLGRSRNRVPLIVAVLVVAAVALVWQALDLRDQRRVADRRADAIELAQLQVLDLTTLSPKTVDAQLSRMEKRVAGEFADELDRFSATFAASVRDSGVSAEGRVEAAAVESIDAGRAQVLIASSAAISSSKEKRPAVRTYRLRVSMEWIKGEWLISGMEFVP